MNDVDNSGPIYLRCDKGNPGELYSSIEFQSSIHATEGYSGIIQCSGDNVIDNLTLMYRNTMGISAAATDGNTIQNCEVGWVGGGSHIIGYNPEWGSYVPASGEGIRMEGNNNTTQNCYVHDTFDGGIIIEFDSDGDLDSGGLGNSYFMDNMTIAGNIVERSMSGILLADHNSDVASTRPTFGKVTITDNYILHSGYGWSCDDNYDFTWGSEDYCGNAITMWDGPNYNTGVQIENNLLYLARFGLFYSGATGDSFPNFAGNTYVQSRGGVVTYTHNGNSQLVPQRAIDDAKVATVVQEVLSDMEASILSLN